MSTHQGTLRSITGRLAENGGSGLPKHGRLRKAILDAIAHGELGPGDQVPPEQELAAATAFSLGTVQRALRRLADEGTLLRTHGRGTFVAELQIPEEALWQFRFLASPDARNYLPVYVRHSEIEIVRRPGAWSRALGPDAAGHVRIGRLIGIEDRLTLWSELYLRAGRFEGLQDEVAKQHSLLNIKLFLRRRFDAPTLAVRQTGRVMPVPDDVARRLDLHDDTLALRLDVTALSHGEEPISFLRIWIPPSDLDLDLSYTGPPARPG